jgi:hypothetical protein
VAGIHTTHGSQAVLVRNDIQGAGTGILLEMGTYHEEPGWAPSKAWLFGNVVHDTAGVGLWVRGNGSSVYGVGNRYERSALSAVHVTGGATYVGAGETMRANTWDGLVVLGCEMYCNDPTCGSPVVVQERSQARLAETRLEGNGADGLFAGCNGNVTLRSSTIVNNTDHAARVADLWLFDSDHSASAPSTLRANQTIFAGEGRGLMAQQGSQLQLGTSRDPGMNSLLVTGLYTIRNATPNHVDAQLNWFGTTNAAAIAASIRDCATNPLFGCVTYEPFLSHAP